MAIKITFLTIFPKKYFFNFWSNFHVHILSADPCLLHQTKNLKIKIYISSKILYSIEFSADLYFKMNHKTKDLHIIRTPLTVKNMITLNLRKLD